MTTGTLLRATRRGWESSRFLAADDGASASGGAANVEDGAGKSQEQTPPAPVTTEAAAAVVPDPTAPPAPVIEEPAAPADPAALDTRATLLKVLNLGDDATDDQIKTAMAQRDADAAAAREAELDTEFAQFSDRITDDKAKTRLRNMLATDREGALEILNGLPAPAAAPAAVPEVAAAPVKPAPPAPVTKTPNADQANSNLTPQQKAEQSEALIKEIRTAPGSKFPTYTAARDAARRQAPHLFS